MAILLNKSVTFSPITKQNISDMLILQYQYLLMLSITQHHIARHNLLKVALMIQTHDLTIKITKKQALLTCYENLQQDLV